MFIGIHCKTKTVLFETMDEGKAVHLFNLAHYGAFNPFSSRHAIASDAYAYENGINVPVGYAHCDHCGVYQVAGLTSSLRIKYAKRSKSKQSRKKSPNKQAAKADAFVSPRQRTLQVTCLACGFVKGHSSLITKKSTVASPNVSEQAKPGKKKKKKRSELSSLLEEKKRMSNSPSPLSLMDFM
ncbi:hypothetical protein OXX79_001502 [Metschnikowia pulcherrima]